MRIWHLSSNRFNSAITEYALSAARALLARGHPTLFTPLIGSAAERRAQENGIPTEAIPRFSIAEGAMLRRMARTFNPDIVMTYGGPEAFLARLVGSGKIVRFRGHDLNPTKTLEGLRQSLSYQGVSLALVPSETLAEKLQSLLSRPIVRPIVLGCDTERFRYRPEAWQSHERPQALVLGRFDPVKGHGDVMRIWAQVLRGWSMGPTPLLHIVGEPANLSVQDLKAAAASAGLILGRDVRITAERVADVSSLLSGASIGIVPSLGSELICRVAEEFLLCGTPVIVSGVGSLNEVLFDESAGASYQNLDHHGAAALMGGWLQRASVEKTETRAARALRAQRFFSFETMGETLEAELRRL